MDCVRALKDNFNSYHVSFDEVCSNKKVYLSDSNGMRTNKFLVSKQTLHYLTKLASLAKWSSVRLRIKWLWVRIPLLSFKLQISCLSQARSSFKFRQLLSVDSL